MLLSDTDKTIWDTKGTSNKPYVTHSVIKYQQYEYAIISYPYTSRSDQKSYDVET